MRGLIERQFIKAQIGNENDFDQAFELALCNNLIRLK